MVEIFASLHSGESKRKESMEKTHMCIEVTREQCSITTPSLEWGAVRQVKMPKEGRLEEWKREILQKGSYREVYEETSHGQDNSKFFSLSLFPGSTDAN